jgi:methanogenic corrinoid protein MtbC1
MRTDIYREATDSIVNADRDGASEVAERALAEGVAPGDIMQNGFVTGI